MSQATSKQQNDLRSSDPQIAGPHLGEDVQARQAETMPVGPDEKGINIRKAISISKPVAELYSFWRNFANLPRFMSHVQEIHVLDDRRSHWKVNAPGGTSVEWDAEIVADEPNRLIAWRSLEGADIRNAGSVRFEEGRPGRGAIMLVELQYSPPLGKLGSLIAKFLGEEPEKQVYDELRAFKQIMEVGEVTISDGSLFGPHLAQRPGQPPSDEDLAKEFWPSLAAKGLAAKGGLAGEGAA